MLKRKASALKERLKTIKIGKRKPLYEVIIGEPAAKFKRRMQKEKDDLTSEGSGMRNAAFLLTLVSMMMALSFIPFFPQPLPMLVAMVVAFAVFVSPPLGLSLGCIPIVLGLLYNLATVDFIAMLGPAVSRVLFMTLLVFFFVALPVRFRRYEDAVGINIGIIAASLLFFNQTYFLAIPLLLTGAVLFKKTQAGLSVAYYVLISVPLMVMQYYQHISTIARADYWNDITAIPPIYTSLAGVFGHMQSAMVQFRMYDMSQIFGRITWEIVAPPPQVGRTVMQAVNQYVDSLPGMVLFVVMVGALVWMVSLMLPSMTSRSSISRGETIFPAVTAAGVCAIFFLFLSSLKDTMAFSTRVTNNQMVIGVIATFLFAIPASLLNYAPKKRAEVLKNIDTIMVKTGSLLTKLQATEELIGKIKKAVPMDVSGPETKMAIIKDKLNEITARATTKKYKVPETYETIKLLDKEIAQGIEGISAEAITLLEQYQLNVNYAYSNWLKSLREIDYEVKTPVQIAFVKEQSPEERIAYISNVLTSSRQLGNDVCVVAGQVYDVIRSLYDPELPAQSRTVSYVKQKLDEKTAPWIACEGLVIALKNWSKHYSRDIAKSSKNLQESLSVLAALAADERLQTTIGEKFPAISEEARKAQQLKSSLSTQDISTFNIVFMKNALDASLSVARNILSTLYDDLVFKAKSIESLQPIQDQFWEKNPTLTEQTAEAIERISNAEKFTRNEMMHSMPEALSYIEPCLWTLSQYNAKNELLLNYPLAKTAIEELLKKRKRVAVQDLPFGATDAEQYLRMFCSERSREFTFDEENTLLTKRGTPA